MASVSITVVFGDNGILQLAKEAAEKTNNAVQNDKQDVQNLVTDIDNIINPPIDISKIQGTVTENTKAVDKYGNKITIPAGFSIVQNGTNDVKYTYDKDENGESTGTPTVQDGIVIKDDENYFVWIPVGTIKNKPNDERGETSKIILGRYTFGLSYNDKIIYDKSKEALLQDARDFNIINDKTRSYPGEYGGAQELPVKKYDNEVAKNLGQFVNNTNNKGGYYIARYEAVKGTDGKVKSKPSTVDSETSNNKEVEAEMVWSNITQPEASKKSQAMYEGNQNFETDLVNSYAWDTALLFIQTYSQYNDYSRKEMNQNINGPKRTGERDDGTTDEVLNMYDLASNVFEWLTETSIDTRWPDCHCVRVGTNCDDGSACAHIRGINRSNEKYRTISFREIMYLIK